MFCHNCGHRNPEGANFCSSCGSVLAGELADRTLTIHLSDVDVEAPDDEIAHADVDVPRGVGVLVVKRGPNVGARYELKADLTRAGRSPESDVFLDDITVSRQHVELRHRGDGRIELRDLGSLNGTYVNRERIDETVLVGGDEVQIGKFKLVYLVAGDE